MDDFELFETIIAAIADYMARVNSIDAEFTTIDIEDDIMHEIAEIEAEELED